MSDSRELLDKANALLGRYRQNAAGDPDIPVLTEVVEFPVSRRDVRTDSPAVPVEKEPGRPSVLHPSGGDLERLELEISRRVLASLREEIASVLDEPLRARLDDHIRRALAAITGQLTLDIETLLHEAVDRAVRAELERSYGPPPGAAQ